jgi:two-component system cell cycle response regulator
MNISKVLLVESDPWDAGLVAEAVAELEEHQYSRICPSSYELVAAVSLAEALEVLVEEQFDVILLDLSLSDSEGLHTFLRMRHNAPDTPIVVFGSSQEEALAVAAVREGAQDYIIKDEIDCLPLARTLRYSIERHRIAQAERRQPLVDDLTGLSHKKGFLVLAEHSLHLAARWRQPVNLLLLEILGQSGLADPTERQSHDLSAIELGAMLRRCYHESDVLGRLDRSRFAVLSIGESMPSLESFLAERDLKVSTTLIALPAGAECNVDELLARAEQAMCENGPKDFELAR